MKLICGDCLKDEIKEILEDNGELIVRYKDNSFECFDTLPKNVLDYITNLQEENERLKQSILNAIDKMNSEMVMINDRGYYYTDISALEDILQINDKDFIDYKSRNEKAKSLTNRTIEIIKQQPSGNDEWILERLNGINYCLGGDEE